MLTVCQALLRGAKLSPWIIIAGCVGVGRDAPPKPLEPPPAPSATGPLPSATTHLHGAPGVRVELLGPAWASYQTSIGSAAGDHVDIALVNRGESAIELGHITVRFVAVRNGIRFACDKEAKATSIERDPGRVDIGERVVLERSLDCDLPLLGPYEIRAYASTVRGPELAATPQHFAGAFVVEVVGRGPVELAHAPGVYAHAAGNAHVKPMPASQWSRGVYRMRLKFTNGTLERARVGPQRASFDVTLAGHAVRCSEAARWRDVPEVGELEPGQSRVVEVPMSCPLSSEGEYDVRVALSSPPVGQDAGASNQSATALAEFPIVVSSDPHELVMPPGPR